MTKRKEIYVMGNMRLSFVECVPGPSRIGQQFGALEVWLDRIWNRCCEVDQHTEYYKRD